MHSYIKRSLSMSQKYFPYLKQSKNPHILNLNPSLVMESKWFANHVAYTMAKYGMSTCVLGMHEEFRKDGIAVNVIKRVDKFYISFIDEDVLKQENITSLANYAYDLKVLPYRYTPIRKSFIGNIAVKPQLRSNLQTHYRCFCSSSFDNDKKLEDLEVNYALKEVINQLEKNSEYKIKTEVDSLKSEFKSEVDSLKSKFKSEFEIFSAEFKGNLKKLEADINRKFLKLFCGIIVIFIITVLDFLFNNLEIRYVDDDDEASKATLKFPKKNI